MFYLSEYLEAHRSEYYDKLLAVTDNNDWQGWVEFFTQAIIIQADSNLAKAQEILSLYDELKPLFIEATRSQFAIPALDAFFNKPIINSTDFIKVSGIENRVTANGILGLLRERNLVQCIKEGGGRTPRVYALGHLLNIAEGKVIVPV
jgi:Fic family protein